MSSIVTASAHMRRALAWFSEYTEANKFPVFVVGKSTPWPKEDDTEVVPTPTESSVIEDEDIICYKYAEKFVFVRPENLETDSLTDTSNRIFYRGSYYREISVEEAQTVNSKWLYCGTWINYDELADVDYRQIGIVTEITPGPNVIPGQQLFLPEDVQEHGDFEVIHFDRATGHSSSKRERLAVIIEF